MCVIWINVNCIAKLKCGTSFQLTQSWTAETNTKYPGVKERLVWSISRPYTTLKVKLITNRQYAQYSCLSGRRSTSSVKVSPVWVREGQGHPLWKRHPDRQNDNSQVESPWVGGLSPSEHSVAQPQLQTEDVTLDWFGQSGNFGLRQRIIKKLQEVESTYPLHKILDETDNYLVYRCNIQHIRAPSLS